MAFSIKDIAGQRFGVLTAVCPTEERRNNHVVWEFKCDCGNTVCRTLASVKYTAKKGFTPNCGCVAKKRIAESERREAERWERRERIAADKRSRKEEVEAIFAYYSDKLNKVGMGDE